MARPTLDDLPFDPKYAGRAEMLTGIQKVRAFSEAKMRRSVYELWEMLEDRAARRSASGGAWTAAAARVRED